MSYIGSKPASKPVVASDLDPTVITGQTALAVAPADTDEFLISDAGVLKRLDASLIGGGKVLQVVTDDLTSEFTLSGSQTFTATGLTLNITPSATSSKIMLFASLPSYINESGNRLVASFFRDSTNLGHANVGLGAIGSHESDCRVIGHIGLSYLDSPSSSSQITYTVKVRLEDASGAGQPSQGNTPSTIPAMEIGA